MAIAKLFQKKKVILTAKKRELYEKNASVIKFLRRNPCIACEQILGIKLMDSQKWILIQTWSKPKSLWCCSRNFGKSFLGAVIMLLKAILYPNQSIYIVSNVGSQAIETMMKIEEIILKQGKTAESCLGLKDIVMFECVMSRNATSVVSHDKASWSLSFFNGSTIKTVNGNSDNNRGLSSCTKTSRT